MLYGNILRRPVFPGKSTVEQFDRGEILSSLDTLTFEIELWLSWLFFILYICNSVQTLLCHISFSTLPC